MSTRAKPVAADYDPEETDSSGRQYPLPEPAQDPTEYRQWLDWQLEKEEDDSNETND